MCDGLRGVLPKTNNRKIGDKNVIKFIRIIGKWKNLCLCISGLWNVSFSQFYVFMRVLKIYAFLFTLSDKLSVAAFLLLGNDLFFAYFPSAFFWF
jgi:hypothetical protein